MAAPKAFNSEEYGFVDLQVVLLGRPIVGLKGIRYKESQAKSNVMGAGRKPIARKRGPVTFEGSVTILMSELRALLQSLGNGKGVTSIKPFDVVVAYAPSVADVISTDRLVYCEVTECEVNISEGDDEIEVELPLIIGDIEWNI
jgi:hypothetical protein